jgi:hypothetical protein
MAIRTDIIPLFRPCAPIPDKQVAGVNEAAIRTRQKQSVKFNAVHQQLGGKTVPRRYCSGEFMVNVPLWYDFD